MAPEILGLLLTAAVAAGWVDAVVGGGGLLLLPALMVAAPTTPLATLLGTNKLGAVFGTASAAIAKAALSTGRNVADLVVEAGLMSREEVLRLISPARLSGIEAMTAAIPIIPPEQ